MSTIRVVQEGFSQNWGGLNERWIRSAINAWYFILPNGQFYKWDGGNNLATSTLFANLSPDCYTNINSRLRDGTASPVSVSVMNNTQLVIAPLNGYIGDYWVELDRYTGSTLTSKTRYHVGFMSTDPNSLGQDWASEKVATTAYSYDDDGRLTHLQQTTAAGTNIATYTYTYDNASRVTTETRNSTTVTYTYDNASQLTGDSTATFTYDATGNRTNSGDTTTTGNQLTSDGTWNYGYDVAGNETSKTKIATGEIWTYGYDLKNQMTSAVEKTSGGAIEMQVNYKYDVFGNRIEQDVGTGTPVVTRFAYDGTKPVTGPSVGNENWNVWADLDGSSSLTTRYLHGDATDQLFARMDGNAPHFYLTDRMGSVRDVIDYSVISLTVTVRDSITYDGYGNITAETNSSYRGRYAWTGREFDVQTGLQYNRARYYDPKTGRWTSQDPLGFDAGDSNLYRYVNNEPTKATDPSGKDIIYLNEPYNSSSNSSQSSSDTSKGFDNIGHTALIVGSNKTGWFYYSFNSTKLTKIKYASYKEMLENPDIQGYKRYVWVKTDAQQDEKASRAADSYYGTRYSTMSPVTQHNCNTLNRDAFREAGSPYLYAWFPNNTFDANAKMWAMVRLGREEAFIQWLAGEELGAFMRPNDWYLRNVKQLYREARL